MRQGPDDAEPVTVGSLSYANKKIVKITNHRESYDILFNVENKF